ncbi:MAG: tandem-95 repeat protein [Planctomycetaceae bacterium]|nr:tandem-95 repeat protein [Planctomycetaceae bacterium]
MMKKMFNFGKTQKNNKSHSSAMRFLPQLEVLEDRHLLSVSSLLEQPITGSLPQTGAYTDLEMHVSSEKNAPAVLGIQIDAVSGSQFDPASVSIFKDDGTQLPSSEIKYINSNYNFDGKTSSLVIAQLAPGDYTIRVSGDNGSFGAFQCDVFLPGDLNHNQTVEDREAQLTSTLYGFTLGQSNAYSLQLLEKLGYKSIDIKVVQENDFDRNGFISQAEQAAAIVNSSAGRVAIEISTVPKFDSLELVNDTGASASDNITTDPAVRGKVDNADKVQSIKASFDGTHWKDVTLDADGAFVLDNDFLKGLEGSPIADDGSIIEGNYTLTIHASNDSGDTDRTLNYRVFINHSPTGSNQSFNTTEKASASQSAGTLGKNDTDPGDAVEIVAGTVTSSLGVTVTINADGSFVYAQGDKFKEKHPSDGVFQDSFIYAVRDVFGATGTGTITINITPENDAPIADPAALAKTTDQDNPISPFDPLANITDPDNQEDLALVSNSVTQPINSNGDVKGEVRVENGNIIFDPKSDFKYLKENESIAVTFEYVVSDGGASVTVPVTVTVTGIDDAPIGMNDTITDEVLADNTEGLGISIADLLANDLAVDNGVTLSFDSFALSDSTKGTLERVGDNLVFRPNLNAYATLGQDDTENVTFTYTVKSSNGLTGTATATITVKGVNSLPTLGTYPASVSVNENATVEISFTDILAEANDPDGDNDNLFIVIPQGGVVQLESGATVTYDTTNNKIIYNPGDAFLNLKANAQGTDTFSFTVQDEKAGTVTGTITVTINGLETPFTINGTITPINIYSNSQNSMITVGNVSDLVSSLINDPDGADGAYHYEITTDLTDQPTFAINPNTGVITVPQSDLPPSGQYILDVEISDNTTSETVTITINVSEKQGPTTPPFELTVNEDATVAVSGKITGIVNDGTYTFDTAFVGTPTFQIDGVDRTTDLPTDYSVSIAADGTVSFNPNGKFDFLPEGKTGKLALTYKVIDDETGAESTGTITINITGANDAPNAGSLITETTDQNTAKTIDVLTQATDPDSDHDTLSISSVGTVTAVTGASVTSDLGTATISNGQILFTPGAGFRSLPQGQSSQVQFTYTITDGTATANNTVIITVNGLNDAPIANADTAQVSNKTEKVTIDVLANDDPVDNLSLTLANIVTQPTKGHVAIENGKLAFYTDDAFDSLAKGDSENVTIVYRVTTSSGENIATVTVTVKGEPPEIPDYAEQMRTTITIPLNDYFDGDNLMFEYSTEASEMLEIRKEGNNLIIYFTDYYSTDGVRNPVQVTITAKDTGGNVVGEQTFSAVAIPQTTASITVIPRKVDDVTLPDYFSATASQPTIDENFTVEVGEQYYLEVWVKDTATLNSQTLSEGLVAIIIKLGIDTDLVDYDGTYYIVSGFDDSSVNTYDKGYISIDLMTSNTFTRVLGTDGACVVRFLVTAKAASNNVPYEVLKDADSKVSTQTNLVLARNPGGIGIDDSQVATIIGNVTQNDSSSSGTPLLAELASETVTAGTVYPRVVTETTALADDGTVADIPQNADWIHEWQEYWVELWVKASETEYFINGSVDLNYNSQYFTATEVELSPAFRGSANPVIDDAAGKITGIGGGATKLVSSNGYILLGRVKFESIGSDNVPFSEASSAHDLGLTVENVNVTTLKNKRFSHVGRLPQTELWAVPYDANDDGCINVNDFLKFLTAYQPLQNTVVFSAYDYNKDGNVNVNDFLALLGNYGSYKRGDNVNITFPESFTQRYVGKTLDTDNAATVNKIIDAANKAWQNALGLEQPIDVQIVVQDLSKIGDGKELANATITEIDAEGRPSKGIIVLDDDGAGLGWYSQIAEPVANGRYDLYTTLLHELGHVYGFNTSYDAFNEVVGDYISQLDGSELHASDPDDVMYATLATGVRKFISQFDTEIISDAYAAAKANPQLGFSNDSAPLMQEASEQNILQENAASLSTEQTGVAELYNGSLLTSLNLAAMISQPVGERIDANTAAQLHAMGLAVATRINQLELEKPRENRTAFSAEQLFGASVDSFFALTDDDLNTIYQPLDADESELALFDLDNEFDADWNV